MQINKIVIIFTLLSVIGCKKGISEVEKHNVKDTLKIQKHETAYTKFNGINNTIKESIVVSCGSGCAMNYSPANITQLGTTIKVKFNVEMYVDEELSDTYSETYFFYYDNSNEVTKIQMEGKNENILENLLPDARDSFIKFGQDLIGDNKKPSNVTYIKVSSYNLPYNKTIDLKAIKYEFLDYNSIKGIEKFKCDTENLRYISLPSKGDINVILVPQDCGDFSYRFFLLTIKNNIVKDNLYVEGEWYEPENKNETLETTNFKIDINYEITVKVNDTEEFYEINEGGKFIKKDL